MRLTGGNELQRLQTQDRPHFANHHAIICQLQRLNCLLSFILIIESHFHNLHFVI